MIDFHIHSYFSDGDQTPQEILTVAERRNLSAIAITDHCDISGRFLYLRDVSQPRPLREYVDEIRNLSPPESLRVFIGLELCKFSPKTPPPPEFAELDFLLIETFPVQTPTQKSFDPIAEALNLKNHYSFPIGLAHPTLSDIEQNINQVDKYGLFLELNFDKLIDRPSERTHVFQRTAELLDSTSKIRLSIGSDAHIISVIGAVKSIWDFVVQHDFLKRLILMTD